jgi:hypothetical protein
MTARRAVPLMTLSVEEAAGLLGVGRTKAYDMSREWRANGGESGLPVIDCGNALRVPLYPLAEMLGVEVSHLLSLLRDGALTEPTTPAPELSPAPTLDPVATTPKPTRNRRKRATPSNQLDLFEHPTAS